MLLQGDWERDRRVPGSVWARFEVTALGRKKETMYQVKRKAKTYIRSCLLI